MHVFVYQGIIISLSCITDVLYNMKNRMMLTGSMHSCSLNGMTCTDINQCCRD